MRLINERPHGAGYLLKQRVIDVGEFIDSVERVAEGGLVVDPEVVGHLLTGAQSRARPGPSRSPTTVGSPGRVGQASGVFIRS
jgi:DNA-binding NarL/FixJ family response regulator